jgi:hypothetical protein
MADFGTGSLSTKIESFHAGVVEIVAVAAGTIQNHSVQYEGRNAFNRKQLFSLDFNSSQQVVETGSGPRSLPFASLVKSTI